MTGIRMCVEKRAVVCDMRACQKCERTVMRKSSQAKGGRNGKCTNVPIQMRIQPCMGPSLRSQTGEGGRPIEPMEDVEGAENNLGLDDIPQGLGNGMDLCWLYVGNEIDGRLSMSGGEGGPRALRAFGKACNGKKRICDKALMVYSSGNWTRRGDETRDTNEFERALYLAIFVSCHRYLIGVRSQLFRRCTLFILYCVKVLF